MSLPKGKNWGQGRKRRRLHTHHPNPFSRIARTKRRMGLERDEKRLKATEKGELQGAVPLSTPNVPKPMQPLRQAPGISPAKAGQTAKAGQQPKKQKAPSHWWDKLWG